MSGDPIASVIATLKVFLKSLPINCLFNVVSFNDSFGQLFPQSEPYNNTNVEYALQFVSRIYADGGTEILPALNAILGAPTREGHPRQVFVLTDGEISNTEQVIQLVRSHALEMRLFSFGIGNK